jgi:fructose-specific phosphotransferase system IIC component
MSKLGMIVKVLFVGNSMLNIKAWGNAQLVANFLFLIAGLVASFTGYTVQDQTTLYLAAVVAGLVNSYLGVATNKEIGLPKKLEPVQRTDLPDLP